MDEAALLEVSRDAVVVVLKIGTPIMLISLIVGLVISLFQALTQIQEATLVFAPKIVAIFISLLIFLPLMGALMSNFMHHIAARIAAM